MNCIIITILMMTLKAALNSEMTTKTSNQCEMIENAGFSGSLPKIPTTCINGSSDIDVDPKNERSESLNNLTSEISKVDDTNLQVEITESIISLTFEGEKLYLSLPKIENGLDHSINTTEKSITTPLGSSCITEIEYLPLEEEDDDSSFYFEKSISDNKTVIESPASQSAVKGQEGTLESTEPKSDDLTNGENNSELGDHGQAEASFHQKSNGGNLYQTNSIQKTINETETNKKLPNGDIPNRILSRSSSRKLTPPKSFLAGSGFDIYNSNHNFEISNSTAETSKDTRKYNDTCEQSPQEEISKKKKSKISWLGCFSKKSGDDSDGDYYRKISDDSSSD